MLDRLWDKFDSLGDYRNDFTLRIRRALSWMECAESCKDGPDGRFIFYWIAFNALYGQQHLVNPEDRERNIIRAYIEKVVAIDPVRFYREIRGEFTDDEIGALVENIYVLAPFWTSGNWKRALEGDAQQVDKALIWGNAKQLLTILFDRLYVLRNQLVHGGATWSGSLNRNQVIAGERFISFLVPRIVDLMLSEPEGDWGTPYYRPVPQAKRSRDA